MDERNDSLLLELGPLLPKPNAVDSACGVNVLVSIDARRAANRDEYERVGDRTDELELMRVLFCVTPPDDLS